MVDCRVQGMLMTLCLFTACARRILGNPNSDEAHCVWYGECEPGWNQGTLNCPASATTRIAPRMTDPDGLRILRTYCPSLYQGDNDTYTCCDPSQLHTIEGNLALPDQLLSRCPACFYNFRNQICQMTCSPTQSNFLIRDLKGACPDGSQSVKGLCGKGIVSVTYVMTDKYAQDLFTSCKDVQMPSSKEKAISVFCGRPAKDCNSTIWLSYMGNTGNGRAPFPVYYNYSNVPYETPTHQSINPLNITNVRCNETVNNSSVACSCQDCQTSCAPVPPPPPAKKPFTIFGIDGISFIMGCIFVVFVIVFGTYSICQNIRDRPGKEYKAIDSVDVDLDSCDNSTSGSHRNLVGTNLVHPSDIGRFERFAAKVENALATEFKLLGRACAKNPVPTILISVLFIGALAGGLAKYQVTTDWVKLWLSKSSTARMQKQYFDSHFGPFYRTEQLIITRRNSSTKVVHPLPPPSSSSITFSSMFELEFMHQILDLQTRVEKLVAQHDGKSVTLQDICVSPLSPDNNSCRIESVFQYWRNSKEELDKVAYDQFGIFDVADYMDHFLKCTQAPASVSDTLELEMSCLATYGGPAFPWVVLGGYDGENYQNATAFVITFAVNNHLEESGNAKAEAWEAEFIKFMKGYRNENMTIAFSSEKAQQDLNKEVNRNSETAFLVVLCTFFVMLCYIIVNIGGICNLDSNAILALGGVAIILGSVMASVGFYSYCNVPMTVRVVEIEFYLVMAVGVNNMFILVKTFQREERKPDETLEDLIGRVLGMVGPSLMLTSLSESTAFFVLGALTDIPAVRQFAMCAALAVLLDFLLQITAFVSLMAVDARRQKLNKEGDNAKPEKACDWLHSFVKIYSQAILSEWLRPVVIVIFVGWFLASVSLAYHIEVGLHPTLPVPKESVLLNYSKAHATYLSVGDPVYFVVPAGLNYASLEAQNAVCGGMGCSKGSLIGQVFSASQLSNYTYIAQPASSWIDDYFDWLNSKGNPPCCRVYNGTDRFCPATVDDETCMRCPFEPQIMGRPSSHDFTRYIASFLKDVPSVKCSKGGHAAYGSAVNLINNGSAVGATYFMTYHTSLKTPEDYINALEEARVLADSISTAMNLTEEDKQVFPYSKFYVFYEQYLTIFKNTIITIGICMGSIFVVTFILLGFDFATAIIVCVTVLMIIIDTMGMMYLWKVKLNTLALVNLVMAVGVSVEFCSHIARAFAVSLKADKTLRAKEALTRVGSSVLGGLTVTKGLDIVIFVLSGFVIWACTRTELLQMFYYPVYLRMIVAGALHGLMFLPVLLTYVGPSINKKNVPTPTSARGGSWRQHNRNDVTSNKLLIFGDNAHFNDRFL